MYKNAKQWARVRDRIFFYGDSIRHVAESEGMSRNTVRKMLKHAHPPGYISFARTKSKNIKLQNTFSADNRPSKVIKDKLLWMEWLYSIEQQSKSRANSSITHSKLFDVLFPSTNSPRTKALAVLARLDGFSIAQIAKHLSIARNTTRKYLSDFQLGGENVLLHSKSRPLKSDNPELKKCIFSLLHEPPTLHGINRTTWRMADLCRILKNSGHSACDTIVRTIIKDAGYRWKSARVVLTSKDPEYREKYQHIQEILSGLKDDERFFSIDEFGPFAVKAKAGRVLVESGEQPTVPQWQKSKGWLILTAALELSRNQVTHFYSKAKNTEEMKRMTDVLIRQYADASKLYISWDAASWHISKELKSYIKIHNENAVVDKLPLVELAPLPASAQFLNVIESVFSGMARAIIHNSDYASTKSAMEAIDRHFKERNQHFIENPKRAGNRIWGMERTNSKFSPSNNCKDPSYR
ncbi:MAG: IS630 family transposase [Methylotenera sp.]|nr:IS630 family transposase [Methylotenera sp.]